jgi:hypothetical protein
VTARSGPQIGYLVRLAGRAAGPAPLRPPRALFTDAGHPLDDGPEAAPDLPADDGPGPRPAVPVRADGLADGPAAPAEVWFSLAAAEAAELPAGPRGTAPGGVPHGDPAPVAPVSGTASAGGTAPAPLHLTTPPGWELGPSGPGIAGWGTAGWGTAGWGTAGWGTAGPGAAGWGRNGPGAVGLPGGGAGAFLHLPAAAAGPSAPAAPSPPTAPPPSSVAPPPASSVAPPPAAPLAAALTPPAPGRPDPAAPPVPDWLRGTPVTLPSAPAALAQPSLPPESAGTPRAGREAVDGRQADVGPDLMPLPARVARPDEHARTGKSRRERPARVTIGTIEVTVVPAARPARGGTEPRLAPPQGVPPRSASGLTGAGGARLRDGLRRWYGIAQG